MGKRIVSINLGNLGSTGTIMHGISGLAKESGYDAIEAYPARFDNRPVRRDDIVLTSDIVRRVNEKLSIITGYNGCFAAISTRRFLRKLDRLRPDLLHFHNLHNSYINLPMLFRYVKKNNIPVVWTLHDCWAFTGQCPHFILSGCEKWKTGCHDCKAAIEYPRSVYDNTKKMYALKKKWFTGVQNMTIVTPSQWLAGLVRQSFLKDYPITVINNGIDLDVFNPSDSDFREKYGLQGKHIVLGVSFLWYSIKGLDVFIKLSELLDDSYQIVLVGTDDEVDKHLPSGIISIHRTQNQRELAEIYSAADVFVNPTREENYPTVNMEAIACGTPVITFNTGGCAEIVDSRSGIVINDDIDMAVESVRKVCETRMFDSGECVSTAGRFSKQSCYASYISLFRKIIG